VTLQRDVAAPSKGVGPLQKILQAKNAQKEDASKAKSDAKSKASGASKPVPPVRKDPYLEQEEMELARLSKLLGIDKSKHPQLHALHTMMTHHNQTLTCYSLCRVVQEEVCGEAEQGVRSV
jgi:hypothetical protein